MLASQLLWQMKVMLLLEEEVEEGVEATRCELMLAYDYWSVMCRWMEHD